MSCGHNTTHTHACQVSYDTHTMQICTHKTRSICVRCILPAEAMHINLRSTAMYMAVPLRRVRWPAMHIYCGRCIRPAGTMHKYIAVLRDLVRFCEVLRCKLLRFQSFMLTFLRFYGSLHAKMTIKLYINSTLTLH